MPPNSEPTVRPRAGYSYVIVGAALFAFIQTFPLLSPILLSFLLILLITLAANPVIARMRALTGGRKVATTLMGLTLVAVMGLTGWAFFVPMKSSVSKLMDQFPTYWERLQKPLIKIEKQAVLSEEKLQAEVTTEIAEAKTAAGEYEAARRTTESAPPKSNPDAGSLRSTLGQGLQSVAGSFSGAAFNVAQILVVLVTVFFGVTFTLMNPRPVFGAMFSMIPERHHDLALTILQRIGKFVPAWAGATALGMITIGLLVFLFMWPIFGFTDALALGLVAGIFEAIPYVGPLLSAVPALLFAAGEGGFTPLWVLLAYTTIQALENNVILPIIMARGMKLHPLSVILSMLLCVAAFGVLGVLVAAPLVAIVDILHDELFRKRYLPTVTDADLDRLSRTALREKPSAPK